MFSNRKKTFEITPGVFRSVEFGIEIFDFRIRTDSFGIEILDFGTGINILFSSVRDQDPILEAMEVLVILDFRLKFQLWFPKFRIDLGIRKYV